MKMKLTRGFTLVELMVSIGIFIFMTVILVARYGNFNQNTFLTNLAYDTAIIIRTAQTYGLGAQGQSGVFTYPYGVHFDKTLPNTDAVITLFADIDANGVYDSLDTPTGSTINPVSTYTITHNATISLICASNGSDCSTTVPGLVADVKKLDVSFKRPNPEAKICVEDTSTCGYTYAKITIQAVDGTTRSVVMRQLGQISVEN